MAHQLLQRETRRVSDAFLFLLFCLCLGGSTTREILLSIYVDGELFGMMFPTCGKLYARGVVIAALQHRAAFGSGGKAGRPVGGKAGRPLLTNGEY